MATWRPCRAAAAFALACGLAFVCPSIATAAPKAPVTQKGREAASKLADVDSAEKYYASLDYQNANAIAGRALTQHGLSHAELVRATRILALTFATLGKEDPAREAFTSLLMMDPDFQIDPNLGPRISTPFIEARGYWRGQPARPGIEVTATVLSSDSAKLVVTTRDPMHVVSSVNVGYRWGATAPFTTRPVAVGDSVTVLVPPAPSFTETRLDYYVEGLDERDGAVFELGNATSPKTAVAEAPVAVAPAPVIVQEKTPGKSIFASPYFWTAVGVVVVGAVVGGVVLFSPKAPNGATLTGGAECGGEPCR
jgi:hypothetical protein